jgi:hypothetical protein
VVVAGEPAAADEAQDELTAPAAGFHAAGEQVHLGVLRLPDEIDEVNLVAEELGETRILPKLEAIQVHAHAVRCHRVRLALDRRAGRGIRLGARGYRGEEQQAAATRTQKRSVHPVFCIGYRMKPL